MDEIENEKRKIKELLAVLGDDFEKLNEFLNNSTNRYRNEIAKIISKRIESVRKNVLNYIDKNKNNVNKIKSDLKFVIKESIEKIFINELSEDINNSYEKIRGEFENRLINYMAELKDKNIKSIKNILNLIKGSFIIDEMKVEYTLKNKVEEKITSKVLKDSVKKILFFTKKEESINNFIALTKAMIETLKDSSLKSDLFEEGIEKFKKVLIRIEEKLREKLEKAKADLEKMDMVEKNKKKEKLELENEIKKLEERRKEIISYYNNLNLW